MSNHRVYTYDAPRPRKKTDEEREAELAAFLAKGNEITRCEPGETNMTPKVLMSTGQKEN